MVRAFRRIARTPETPLDPGYEAVEWKRLQVLFPDWTPADMQPHDENVEVYSNAEAVELFLNGKSLGRKAVREDAGALSWNVPYESGTLRAVAYLDGEEVARDVLRTAGEANALVLKPDRPAIGTNWDDVATIEVSIVDAQGTLVPTAANRVQFTVSGPGKLIAVDSGNVVSTEPFNADRRFAYQGRCIAIVRATGAGAIQLTATVAGLDTASVAIEAGGSEPDPVRSLPEKQ